MYVCRGEREGGIYRPCVYSVVCRRRIYRYRQGGRGGGGPLSVPHPVSVFFLFTKSAPFSPREQAAAPAAAAAAAAASAMVQIWDPSSYRRSSRQRSR